MPSQTNIVAFQYYHNPMTSQSNMIATYKLWWDLRKANCIGLFVVRFVYWLCWTSDSVYSFTGFNITGQIKASV